MVVVVVVTYSKGYTSQYSNLEYVSTTPLVESVYSSALYISHNHSFHLHSSKLGGYDSMVAVEDVEISLKH